MVVTSFKAPYLSDELSEEDPSQAWFLDKNINGLNWTDGKQEILIGFTAAIFFL